MKNLIIVAIVLTSLGCAKVRVNEKYNNEVTLCGNTFADSKDYEKAAKQECGGTANYIGFRTKTSGLYYTGYRTAVPIEKRCQIWKCGN